MMVTGLFSALMKLKAYMNAMVMPSKLFTLSMNNKDLVERQLRPKSFGKLLLTVKLKLVPHICSTKIMLTTSQTINILELLRALTSAVKLSNIPHQMKSLFAT